MRYDVVIVGAGAVGLATAYSILKERPKTKLAIIEREAKVAAHQTGNNSGVIHSGVYYKPGSLKAKNCVEGYDMLLDFCKEYGIDYDLCGKIILATDEWELPILNDILDKGKRNGLTNLEIIGPERIVEIEPHAKGIQAIKVPQTGIIDYKAVCNKLYGLVTEMGGEFYFGEKVVDLQKDSEGNRVVSETNSYSCQLLINCAGLYSDYLAKMSGQKIDFQIIPFRGEYYKFKEERKHLVKHLIYPVPDPNFPWLGVHFTRMMDGAMEAGPNAVLAFKREGYEKSDIDLKELAEIFGWGGFRKMAFKYWKAGLSEFYRSYSKAAFVKALQRLVPEITSDDLEPAPAGVRALACGRNGELLDDFLILESRGIIDVGNAPSPAATSCLAIGKSIKEKAFKQLA